MSSLCSLASGIIFGAALTAAGVAAPSVIVNQMRLTDFHMLLAFLAASACSALIIAFANYTKYAKLGHRTDASYGWFMPYDANIVGGAMIGAGMSLTGACPGTVLVQMSVGLRSAWWIGLGNVLGGVAYVRIAPMLRRRNVGGGVSQYTVMEKTGLSTSTTVLLYEVVCLAMMLSANYLPRCEYWLNPVSGGIGIGVAQATSVVLTKKSLGVSSAYEDIGKAFWSVVDGTAIPTTSSTLFALGIMAGTRLALPFLLGIKMEETSVSSSMALLGGFVMIFGSRLAGGCTSGHGISGMSTMSLSSFITVAAMFGGGIVAAAVM